MKAVIQRINFCSVTANGQPSGNANNGLLVLLGVHKSDTEKEAQLLAKKVANLRVFCDSDDKMNLSVSDVDGEILCVSNFTLCADTKKGNRPSFIEIMAPAEADRLYNLFIEELKANGVKKVEHGVFGAEMIINAELNGPITIILDTDIWSKK